MSHRVIRMFRKFVFPILCLSFAFADATTCIERIKARDDHKVFTDLNKEIVYLYSSVIPIIESVQRYNETQLQLAFWSREFNYTMENSGSITTLENMKNEFMKTLDNHDKMYYHILRNVYTISNRLAEFKSLWKQVGLYMTFTIFKKDYMEKCIDQR